MARVAATQSCLCSDCYWAQQLGFTTLYYQCTCGSKIRFGPRASQDSDHKEPFEDDDDLTQNYLCANLCCFITAFDTV